jgi:hypothetical protein
MKNSQKITRVQLKSNHVESVALFGIVSSEPDYKLSQSLNKKFRISLKNISPVVLSEKGNELTFSRFSEVSKSHDITYTLISNRTIKAFLLKKLKNIDYIFHVEDPSIEDNMERISSLLKEIESITAVFYIDPKLFKDKDLQYLTH